MRLPSETQRFTSALIVGGTATATNVIAIR
jgi:hypothetical protein